MLPSKYNFNIVLLNYFVHTTKNKTILHIHLKVHNNFLLLYFQVNQKREKLYKKQEELERRQREEEDRLINAMLTERSEEFKKLEEEEKGDWESRLKELTSKFDQEMNMGKKSGKYKKNEDIKVKKSNNLIK